MKRILKPLLLCAALSALLCVSAFAKDDVAGLYGASAANAGTTFSYEDANGAPVTSTTAVTPEAQTGSIDVYNGAVKLNVAYNGTTDGAYYLILVTNTDLMGTTQTVDATKITDSTVEYIDQKTAASDSVDFTVYQKSFASDKTYYVYLASNAGDGMGLTQVGSYKYFSTAPAYTLGDVNGDESIDVLDLLLILDYTLGRTDLSEGNRLAAADVNGDNGVDVLDLLRVLDYTLGRIPAFD